MMELKGRTALVTGGSKGIGLACGHALAGMGARVALCARDADALEAAAAKVREATGAEVVVVPADLSTAEGAERAVELATELLGQIDVLVNNAGAAPPGTIDKLTDEQWDVAIELKLRGYIRLIRGALPGMVERGFGRIINIAGTAGKQPDGWLITAGTVNAAVMALTKAVATSTASTGVTVNAVCPGPTETDRWAGMQNAHAGMFGGDVDSSRSQILSAIPSGRPSTPQEVAYAAAFFAGEAATNITGQSLMVDGGLVKSV